MIKDGSSVMANTTSWGSRRPFWRHNAFSVLRVMPVRLPTSENSDPAASAGQIVFLLAKRERPAPGSYLATSPEIKLVKHCYLYTPKGGTNYGKSVK